MVLRPTDFAPYIISLSVTDEGEWRGCRLLFESVLNDTEAIVNNMRARFEPRVAPENTCGRHSGTVAAMAKRDLTREWTEQFGFRLISDSVNFTQCGVKDILSEKFFNSPAMELTFFAYSDGEYSASPCSLPNCPIWANGTTSLRDVLQSQNCCRSWMRCTATCLKTQQNGLWSISSGLVCCWQKVRSC